MRGKAITEQRASSTSARPKTYKGLSQKKKQKPKNLAAQYFSFIS